MWVSAVLIIRNKTNTVAAYPEMEKAAGEDPPQCNFGHGCKKIIRKKIGVGSQQ